VGEARGVAPPSPTSEPSRVRSGKTTDGLGIVGAMADDDCVSCRRMRYEKDQLSPSCAFPDFAMAVKGRALRRALPAALRFAAPA
jgi:hypothetical protein